MLTEKDVIIDCDESGTRTVTVKGKTVFSGSHPTFLVDVDDSRILLQCLEPSTEAFAGTAWKSYRVFLQESPDFFSVSELNKDLLADNKWLRKRLNELEANKDSLTPELKVVREERDRLKDACSRLFSENESLKVHNDDLRADNIAYKDERDYFIRQINALKAQISLLKDCTHVDLSNMDEHNVERSPHLERSLGGVSETSK